MNFLKTLTLIIIGSIVFFACGTNQDEVPDAIVSSFNREYPQATDVEWEDEGDEYEVEFEVDDIEREITYNQQGEVVETGIDVSEDELPEVITQYIAQNYSGYEIDDADEVERQDGQTYIEVEIENNQEEVDLLFNFQGEFVQAEVDED
ncbi:MAG: PepSY-like domain-containing protein [Candidatus Cyclobacteriaceae bacterium M3_2C_046]